MAATFRFDQLTRGFFAVSILICLVGLYSYFAHPTSKTLAIKTSLTERDLAIEQALKTGKKTYTYTTHFIPGIGYITDPNAYQQQALDQLKKQVDGSN